LKDNQVLTAETRTEKRTHCPASRQDVQFSDTMHKSVCPVAARHASKLHDIMQGLHGLARSRLAFL